MKTLIAEKKSHGWALFDFNSKAFIPNPRSKSRLFRSYESLWQFAKNKYKNLAILS
jgi:hypothetical protein